MIIKLGSRVECRDEPAGTVKRLILDSRSFDLCQLVVEHGGLLATRDLLVPVERIYEVREDAVILDMSVADLEKLPDFEETVYTPLSRLDRRDPTQMPPADIDPALLSLYYIPQVPVAPTTPPLVSHSIKHLAPNLRDIQPGMEVYAGDQKVGEIATVTVDSVDKRATSFVVKRGWLFHHDLEIPADWVSAIENGRVLLNRTKEQIEDFDATRRSA